ncbi:MAG: glycosyltransferase [Clostridia bacterium]|nr:glycosyltransferase [Clostridia bacterium]
MQILYGFSNCTDSTYNRIVAEKNAAILQPDQKYHGLLIKGLAEGGASVTCFSGLPVNRSVTKRLIVHEKNEVEGGVRYRYFTTINLPLFRQAGIFLASFFSVLFFRKKKQQTAVVCDCLNIANAFGMTLAGKLRRIPVVTIVTDLPDMMGGGALRNFNNKLFSLVDGFLLLTEQMNDRVNKKGKPHLVLEGHVNAADQAANESDAIEETTGKRVILYAGSVCKLYGIAELVDGFLAADLENAELHIYGDGDYREDLQRISSKHPSVVYHGVCPNREIVKEEHRVSLLVNPRPTAPEYTKYSFPSKNMEYMVSGTPLLTTKLPGMPKEYHSYVYLIEEDTADGIKSALQKVFSLPLSERREKGNRARAFVLANKTNLQQAKKLLDFIGKEFFKG